MEEKSQLFELLKCCPFNDSDLQFWQSHCVQGSCLCRPIILHLVSTFMAAPPALIAQITCVQSPTSFQIREESKDESIGWGEEIE